MKSLPIERADLESCVRESQGGRVLVTRDGAPIAIVVGVAGLDAEQVDLGTNASFWSMIEERRGQETIDRAELERRLDRPSPAI